MPRVVYSLQYLNLFKFFGPKNKINEKRSTNLTRERPKNPCNLLALIGVVRFHMVHPKEFPIVFFFSPVMAALHVFRQGNKLVSFQVSKETKTVKANIKERKWPTYLKQTRKATCTGDPSFPWGSFICSML